MPDQLLLGLDIPETEWRRRHCPVCGGALRQPPGDTYVMQRQGWVKIGKSKHVTTRFRELHATNRQRYIICPEAMDRHQPLILLAVIHGDHEHELHQRWACCYVQGEWFLPDVAMRAWLATACLPGSASERAAAGSSTPASMRP